MKKQKCEECGHGICKTCNWCHNMLEECTRSMRPFNSCFNALIKNAVPSQVGGIKVTIGEIKEPSPPAPTLTQSELENAMNIIDKIKRDGEDTQPTGEGTKLKDVYAPEVIMVRRVLAKYMHEWKADMLAELADLLLSSHEKVIKEISARFYGQTRIDWKDLEAHLKSNLK